MDSNPKPPNFVMSTAMVNKSDAGVSAAEKPIHTRTAPFDPRFPNTNQALYCWVSYLDFHRCQKKRGEGDEICEYYKNLYRSVCPDSWTEKWDNGVAKGTFPGKI